MSLTTITDSFYRLNLLTEVTYQEVRRLAQLGELRRSRLLRYAAEDDFRLRFDFDEFFGGDESIGGIDISIVGEMPIEELQGLLQQLNEMGVLSSRVYEKLQEDLIVGLIRLDIALLQHAATQMELDEQLQPEVVEPFLQELTTFGVLSDEKRTQLLQALSAGQVENPIEFLRYMNRALLFDLHDRSLTPYDYFLQIHEAIAQMLTHTRVADIRLDDFRLELVDRKYCGLPQSYDAIVSVLVNGRQYQQVSFYAPPERTERSPLAAIDSDEVIHLFNKILRDRASPYRLHTIAAQRYDLGFSAEDDSRFGVLALTQEQAEHIQWRYFGPNGQNYDTSLTSDRLAEILSLFEQIGLFDHLTAEQIKAGRQRIAQSHIVRPYELLAAFPSLLVAFEWESGNVDNPYQDLTYEFAAASRGAFTPTDISNEFDWDNQTAGQSFVVNGTHYSKQLEFNDDWLDPAFFTFIEEVVAATVSEGRFYPIYDESEMVGYLFLTDEQRRILQTEGLITLGQSMIEF